MTKEEVDRAWTLYKSTFSEKSPDQRAEIILELVRLSGVDSKKIKSTKKFLELLPGLLKLESCRHFVEENNIQSGKRVWVLIDARNDIKAPAVVVTVQKDYHLRIRFEGEDVGAPGSYSIEKISLMP